MRAPKFWEYGSKSLRSTCLLPIAHIYNTISSRRAQKKPIWRASIPVLCIGNLIMGGAGKTPSAIALAKEFIAQGKKPYFLSRGYGGTLKGPLIVSGHSPIEVGDEPLLLSKTAPVCVSHDRIDGAKACIAAGANMIIMDDGFQNPNLHKDLSILIIDGGYGHGNEKTFPAGPLREQLSSGLKRAGACIIIGKDKTQSALRLKAIAPDLPIFQAHIKADVRPDLVNTKVFAFAGIGRPEKFYTTLKDMGCELVGEKSFPDHHFFSDKEIINLQNLAKNTDATLITTEKDWLRLPEKIQNQVDHIKITLEWDDKDMLNPIIDLLNS